MEDNTVHMRESRSHFDVNSEVKLAIRESLFFAANLKDLEEHLSNIVTIVSSCSASVKTRAIQNNREWLEFLCRVQAGDAVAIFRKPFLISSAFNVMQEFWYWDKNNPLAQSDPLKSYAVLHVHYHSSAEVLVDCTEQHFEVIDAMNLRHLAPSRAGDYTAKNPYVSTFIEPSGKKTWKIPIPFNTTNAHSAMWNWKQTHRELVARASESLVFTLVRCAHRQARIWLWGQTQHHRSGHEMAAAAQQGFSCRPEDLLTKFESFSKESKAVVSPSRIGIEVLALGIGDYSYPDNLDNSVSDAAAILEAFSSIGAGCLPLCTDPMSRAAILDEIELFSDRINLLEPRPRLAVLYVAGHGFMYESEFFLVPTRKDLRKDLDWNRIGRNPGRYCVSLKELACEITCRSSISTPLPVLLLIDCCRCQFQLSHDNAQICPSNHPEPDPNVIIWYSTGRGAVAYDCHDENGRMGPFARSLIEELISESRRGRTLSHAFTLIQQAFDIDNVRARGSRQIQRPFSSHVSSAFDLSLLPLRYRYMIVAGCKRSLFEKPFSVAYAGGAAVADLQIEWPYLMKETREQMGKDSSAGREDRGEGQLECAILNFSASARFVLCPAQKQVLYAENPSLYVLCWLNDVSEEVRHKFCSCFAEVLRCADFTGAFGLAYLHACRVICSIPAEEGEMPSLPCLVWKDKSGLDERFVRDRGQDMGVSFGFAGGVVDEAVKAVLSGKNDFPRCACQASDSDFLLHCGREFILMTLSRLSVDHGVTFSGVQAGVLKSMHNEVAEIIAELRSLKPEQMIKLKQKELERKIVLNGILEAMPKSCECLLDRFPVSQQLLREISRQLSADNDSDVSAEETICGDSPAEPYSPVSVGNGNSTTKVIVSIYHTGTLGASRDRVKDVVHSYDPSAVAFGQIEGMSFVMFFQMSKTSAVTMASKMIDKSFMCTDEDFGLSAPTLFREGFRRIAFSSEIGYIRLSSRGATLGQSPIGVALGLEFLSHVSLERVEYAHADDLPDCADEGDSALQMNVQVINGESEKNLSDSAQERVSVDCTGVQSPNSCPSAKGPPARSMISSASILSGASTVPEPYTNTTVQIFMPTIPGFSTSKDPIGVGAQGSVWLAQDEKSARQVAIKIISNGSACLSEREAQNLRLVKHSNVVRFLQYVDATELGGHYSAIVMEFVVGEKLGSFIHRSGGFLPLETCLEVMDQLLSGLAEMHRMKMIHRDIKPSNIMRQADGHIVIVDLGLSKQLKHEEHEILQTQTWHGAGTSLYLSPEQAQGLQDIDLRADVWAAGVVMYQMLAGKVPFEGKNQWDLNHQISQKDFEDIADVGRATNLFLNKALSKKRCERFEDASKMRECLLHLAPQESTSGKLAPVLVSFERLMILQKLRRDGALKGDLDDCDSSRRTTLMLMCKEGNDGAVQKLLRAGADIFLNDFEGNSCLQYAAAQGHAGIVQMLLEEAGSRGVPPQSYRSMNDEGMTALFVAAELGHVDCMRMFLSNGSKPSRKSSREGNNCLHWAVLSGNCDAVAIVLAHPESETLLRENNVVGHTPLIAAARNGNVGLVEALLNAGASSSDIDGKNQDNLLACLAVAVREQDCDILDRLLLCRKDLREQLALVNLSEGIRNLKQTPLLLAAFAGNHATMSVLIKHSADVAAVDKLGQTCMHHCALEGHEGVLDLLLQSEARSELIKARTIRYHRTPLLDAAWRGNVQMMMRLLQVGAEILESDKYGKNCMHYTAMLKSDVTQHFLEQVPGSIDMVDGITSIQQTPLMLAVKDSNISSVKALISAKANISYQDEDGNTCLHHAASQSDTAIVHELHALLEFGEILELKNGIGMTPLLLAAWSGQAQIWNVLLLYGANVAAVDVQGNNCLHCACDGGHKAVFDLFSQNFALDVADEVIAAQNKIGETCLILACRWGHIDVASALLNLCARPMELLNTRDAQGMSALDHAREEVLEDVVELLSNFTSNHRNAD